MSLEQIKQTEITDAVLIEQLEPTAAEALNVHLSAKDKQQWLPYQLVPFEKLSEVPKLPDATLSALYVNGLTEDNLPHYTATIKRLFGNYDAWREWNGRWTWEESLHTRGIERFIDHTGVFDPAWLEGARKQQLTLGEVPEPNNIPEMATYVTIQEELTRVAHMRLGKRLAGIGKGALLFSNIAGDEGRHHRFYREISTVIREQFPDQFALGALAIIRNFAMPGTGISGYKEHADLIEKAGIFTRADVARAISDIATKFWAMDTLGDDLKSEVAKATHPKIMRTLGAYTRIAKMEIGGQEDVLPPVTWKNGVPIILY
jgi:acyl-[acyl-carrier-protein] desaturase